MTGILGRYFAARFFKTILLIFFGVFALIVAIDYLEISRRVGDADNVSSFFIFQVSLFRAPNIAEQIFPFAVLFGSIVTLLQLSRKQELIVARSAGISAWQFLQPGIIVAFLFGLFSVSAFNPLSAYLKMKATSMEAEISSTSGKAVSKDIIWLRQSVPEGGYAIIQADGIFHDLPDPVLAHVTLFVFEQNGIFKERIEARTATLKEGFWVLDDVERISLSKEPVDQNELHLPTRLKPSQLLESFTSPDLVPFWQLRSAIRQARQAGLDPTRYHLQFASLIMQPFLFIAMVLVAASVSLRFFRFGGIARLVLGGIFAGFVLYVATQLVQELGATGFLPPWIAAATPVFIGALLGTLVLLHQEDG